MTGMKKTLFTEAFVRLNRLEETDFVHWVFLSGMEFGACNKWWKSKGSRPTPHEGLDFRCFKDSKGNLKNIAEKSLVPIMYAGTVVKIFPDLLGSSILIAHESGLYSIYAHTDPDKTLQAGSRVMAGESIAMISSTGKRSILPHLHLSVIRAEESAIADLDWETINKRNGVMMCDPLDFFDEGLTIKAMQ